MITEQQKAYLVSCKYEVEAMDQYGPQWVGFWRWVHPMHGPDAEPQESEQAAWDDAHQYQAQYLAYMEGKQS